MEGDVASSECLVPLQSRSNLVVVGPTGTGKTHFVNKLLKDRHKMFQEDPPKHILYCYGIHQPLFEKMEKEIDHITFHEGLPSETELTEFQDTNHNIIVLDDLMHKVCKSEEMELLFTQGAHHRNFSVILIVQNLFKDGKHYRTMMLNASYLVLMKNFGDASQISCLGRQMFPGQNKMFMQAYDDATSQPYGYLMIDMSPHSDNRYRLRSLIFPSEATCIYLPKE